MIRNVCHRGLGTPLRELSAPRAELLVHEGNLLLAVPLTTAEHPINRPGIYVQASCTQRNARAQVLSIRVKAPKARTTGLGDQADAPCGVSVELMCQDDCRFGSSCVQCAIESHGSIRRYPLLQAAPRRTKGGRLFAIST